MFTRAGVTYAAGEPREGERYSPQFRMYTSDAECGLPRVQYHRFEEGGALPELIRTVPHAAFKVSDPAKAVEGRTVLLGPYEPIDGFRVAVIQDGEAPVELIETTLTDERVWSRAKSGDQASIYRQA
ncbi:hypothetical protein [Caballeronia ptereochthonis]|uniref:Uncharacterized protein n=1 Tax=Caballeronia ptereochthonis TaxID=1777144 RepID=A0A157ZCS5_9BURK|nr:hypothetical protein [Caballeronia ptereochthonis]SAK43283.1 hypothetical protein AWB83_00433 [Caballeronia ptereochthonis]